MTTYRTIRIKVPSLTACEVTGDAVTEAAEAATAARAFLEKQNAPKDREVFGILCMNARGKVMGASLVSIGTATAALVHPREVFRDALAVGAISIIHFHTHPSGEVTPSSEDQVLHHRLQQAGDILGIPVLDGLVLSPVSNAFRSIQE